MTTLIFGLLGLVLAILAHRFSWWVRLNHRIWSVIVGALGASAVTALAMIYVLWSDIGDFLRAPLLFFWGFAILIGVLQAASIPAPWWAGVLGLLFEMALGFVLISAINLTLQRLVLQWRLADRFPEMFAYPGVIVDPMIYVFLAVSSVLAVIRPVLRLRRR